MAPWSRSANLNLGCFIACWRPELVCLLPVRLDLEGWNLFLFACAAGACAWWPTGRATGMNFFLFACVVRMVAVLLLSNILYFQ